jgi:hypothetical protein
VGTLRLRLPHVPVRQHGGSPGGMDGGLTLILASKEITKKIKPPSREVGGLFFVLFSTAGLCRVYQYG